MDSLLQDLVSAQSEHRWDDGAIVAGPAVLTYGELETQSDQIAGVLRESGCGRGDRVSLFASPSPVAVVAMLGILKADCTYVPVDCGGALADLSWIVQACQPRVLLTDAGAAPVLSDVLIRDPRHLPRTIGSLETRALETSAFRSAFCLTDVAGLTPRRLVHRNWPADTAFVRFSASRMGVPKGAAMSHEECGRFLVDARQRFGVQAGDRHSAYAPLSADLAIYDVLGALEAGAAVHVTPAPGTARPMDLAAFIREHELTQWSASEETLAAMAEAEVIDGRGFASLKRVIWSGDAVPSPALRYWMARMPGTLFSSLDDFVPAETTPADDGHNATADWPAPDATSPAMRARLQS